MSDYWLSFRKCVPKRVLAAWDLGAEQELIAYAAVSEQGLCILDCALNVLTVPFEALPVLQTMAPDARQQFELYLDRH